MSLDLLSVLADRESHDRFARFIKPETLSAEMKQVVSDITAYYEDNPSYDHIKWDVFEDWFRIVRHSSYKEDKLLIYSRIFELMEEHAPTDLAETIITKCIGQDYAQQIADIALQAAEGEIELDLPALEELIREFCDETDRASKLDSFFVTDDIESLVERVEGGYEWSMEFLNRATGNARPGKLIVVAMRPNTGKTTFMAKEATHIASQMEPDECVLWFNNEEAGADVKMRIIQAATGLTVEKIRDKPAAAVKAYGKAVNGDMGKIKVVDKADLSVKDVEEIVRNQNVKMIVFDQLWKVHGFEKHAGTDTARLGMVFQWARELAKKYECPVMTSHQVKTEGEGVEYLPPSMLYLSGTIIQGEADTIIFMGRNFDAGKEYMRYISIGKNKGAHGPRVDPAYAGEARAIVELIPHTAQWKES